MADKLSWSEKPGIQHKDGIKDSSFPQGELPISFGSWWMRAFEILSFLLIILFCLRMILGTSAGTWFGGGELQAWLYRYWWMKQMVSTAFSEGGFFYGLYALCVAGSYPEFGNVFHLQLFSWPLEFILGDCTYYNIEVVLVLFLNCFCCHQCLKRIWGHTSAAWLGSIIYGCNPYFLAEISAGRLRQAIGFTIPLFILYFYRMWRRGDWKDTLWAGLWLGATAVFYLYYGMFLGFLWVGIWVWYWLSGRRLEHAQGFVVNMIFVTVISLMVTLPFVQSYIERAAHGTLGGSMLGYGAAMPSLDELVNADAKARPGNLSVGYEQAEQWAQPWDSSWNSNRFVRDSVPLDAFWNVKSQYTLPLAVLLILVIPWNKNNRGKYPWLWLGTFAFFIALAFGPYLTLGTDERVFLSRWPVYSFFYKWMPAFNRLYSPIRLVIMVYFSLAVLLCIKYDGAYFKLRDRMTAVAVVALICFLVQMEHAGVCPVTIVNMHVAPFYYVLGSVSGQDSQDKSPSPESWGTGTLDRTKIIEVPYKTGDFLEYYQQVHKKHTLGSFTVGALPPHFPRGDKFNLTTWLAQEENFGSNTFVNHLIEANQKYEALDKLNYLEDDLQELREAGYSLLILHERGCYLLDDELGEVIYFKMLDHFRQLFGEPILYTDEPVASRLDGRFRNEQRPLAWYRMCVFALDGKQKNKSATKTLTKPSQAQSDS